MLQVIEGEPAIKKCHAQFLRQFKPAVDERIPVHIGHQGASVRVNVGWMEHFGIWIYSKRIAGSRFWNAFGIDKPQDSAYIPIVCEINFPAKGIDRRIGGAMARDRQGRVFAVHRGKIGGGKKGIGKSLFENQYRGAWTLMEDGENETAVALIGEPGSPRFIRQVKQFIRKVAAIKDQASPASPQMTFPFDDLRLRDELLGTVFGRLVEDESSACDHGLVVRDLHAMLKKKGIRSGNDENRDLYIADPGGRIDLIIKVLTDISEKTVYAEATRLLLDSRNTDGQPRTILAVPGNALHPFKEPLAGLHVGMLPYTWQNDQAVFPDTHSLFPQ